MACRQCIALRMGNRSRHDNRWLGITVFDWGGEDSVAPIYVALAQDVFGACQ